MECKYNLEVPDGDIFLFLTDEDVKILRCGKPDPERDFMVTTLHRETGTLFSLVNPVCTDSGYEIEVLDQDPHAIRIRISDVAYEKLTKNPDHMIGTRYGMDSKVMILIDPEMVELLKNRPEK